MGVAGEAGADIPAVDQQSVDRFPVASRIQFERPSRMMHEHEDMPQAFHFIEGLAEEVELGGAESLLYRVLETAHFVRPGWIALV